MFFYFQRIKCYISHKINIEKNNENITKTKRNKRTDISHILIIYHHLNNLKIYSQQREHFI